MPESQLKQIVNGIMKELDIKEIDEETVVDITNETYSYSPLKKLIDEKMSKTKKINTPIFKECYKLESKPDTNKYVYAVSIKPKHNDVTCLERDVFVTSKYSASEVDPDDELVVNLNPDKVANNKVDLNQWAKDLPKIEDLMHRIYNKRKNVKSYSDENLESIREYGIQRTILDATYNIENILGVDDTKSGLYYLIVKGFENYLYILDEYN